PAGEAVAAGAGGGGVGDVAGAALALPEVREAVDDDDRVAVGLGELEGVGEPLGVVGGIERHDVEVEPVGVEGGGASFGVDDGDAAAVGEDGCPFEGGPGLAGAGGSGEGYAGLELGAGGFLERVGGHVAAPVWVSRAS